MLLVLVVHTSQRPTEISVDGRDLKVDVRASPRRLLEGEDACEGGPHGGGTALDEVGGREP